MHVAGRFSGDRSRIQGIKPREPKGSSQSTYFFQHNHSKRSLALQWKHPRTTGILRALVAKADVLVENFSPGVMARAGLSYQDLSAINPRLVMCSISVAGQVVGTAYAMLTVTREPPPSQ